MKAPSWYASIAQPARWGVAGTMTIGGAAAIGGLVEAIEVYPLSSWFGVTLYMVMLGSVAGFALGLLAAVVTRRAS